MDEAAIQRAMERIAGGRADTGDVDAALARAKDQIEALAVAAAELESTLPTRVGDALSDGFREHMLPATRHLAEVRGLMNQVIRRLERIEGDVLSERHARVDDLALLVDLIAAGWRSVEDRITQLESRLQREGAVVYRLEDRDRHAS
jgi:hypothetical protein